MTDKTTPTEREPILWAGRPSQFINFKKFFWCTLFCWLIVPIFIGLWHWLVVRNIQYTLSAERLRTRQGVFNKSISDLELYRVKDLHVVQPFFLRIVGKSHIVLYSSDRSNPQTVLCGVAQGERLKDLLRERVEAMRQSRGVREFG